MNRLLLLLAIPLLLVVAACSSFTPEQEQEYQQLEQEQITLTDGATALIDTIFLTAPRAGELLQKSWDGTLTDLEATELAALLATGPAEVQQAISRSSESLASWWDLEKRKVELREEAGGGWWEEAAIAAGSLVVGMGVPTAGPFGALLGGLAPFLEALGIRNGRKRNEYHIARAEEGAKGYKGPGDTVPPRPS